MADDDAIYVDIVPRLDEAAADAISDELEGKFKDVGKHALDGLKDASKSIKDAFGSDIGKDIGKQLGKNVGDELGKLITPKVTDALENVGTAIRGKIKDILPDNVLDALNNPAFGEAVKGMSGDLRSLPDILKKVKDGHAEAAGGVLSDILKQGGGIAGSLGAHGVSDNLNKVAKTVDTVTDEVGKLTDAVAKLKSGDKLDGLQNLTKTLGGTANALGLPGGGVLGQVSDVVGNVSTGMQGISSAVAGFKGGDVGAGINGLNSALSVVPDSVTGKGVAGKLLNVAQGAAGGVALGAAIPGLGETGIPEIVGGVIGGGLSAYDQFTGQPDGPKSAQQQQLDKTHAEALRRHGAAFLAAHPEDDIGGSASAAIAPAAPAAPARASASSGKSGGGCDGCSSCTYVCQTSGTRPAVPDGGVGSTGGGHVAPVKSGPDTSASGLGSTGGLPHKAGGGMVHGNGPRGVDSVLSMLAPGERVLTVGQTKAYDAMMGSLPHFSGGGKVSPTTDPQNTTVPVAMPPPQGKTPKTQQSEGSGQGFGVTGGGLIGAAEGAAAMAAGPLAPAVQAAEQEANLAIKKGGQIAATMAMAPIETFGLHGGMMGAPSVKPGGWAGKLVGGLMGAAQGNIPNIAGASQPPKDPKSDKEDQIAPGPKPGPKGDKDDPIHVRSVTPQPGPPQGSTTSDMNMAGRMISMPA